MRVKVTTRSGSVYYFDDTLLTWERLNKRPILGIPLTSDGYTGGDLVEWPSLIVGRGIMFDDIVAGVVYTTPIEKAEVLWDDV